MLTRCVYVKLNCTLHFSENITYRRTTHRFLRIVQVYLVVVFSVYLQCTHILDALPNQFCVLIMQDDPNSILRGFRC